MLRVLWAFAIVEVVLLLPILAYPGHIGRHDWKGPGIALLLAVVAVAVLLGSLAASVRSSGVAVALGLIGAIVGAAAVYALLETAYFGAIG